MIWYKLLIKLESVLKINNFYKIVTMIPFMIPLHLYYNNK